jgi:prepilin-type N-terminal cleavage/methylation domain-containing protein
MHAFSRGFTLIELLVVIAIIGMLTSVVLASLTSARQKAADASIKSQARTIANAAALYYSTYGTYGATVAAAECPLAAASGLFSDTALKNAIAAAKNISGANVATRCTTNGTNYAISIKLRSSGNHWCVDSQSAAKEITDISLTGYLCP